MMLEIPEDVAERLKALAKQSDREVADILREMLMRYESEIAAKGRKWATAADLARVSKIAALELDALRVENSANSQPTNTAANSREILKEIYAEKFGSANK